MSSCVANWLQTCAKKAPYANFFGAFDVFCDLDRFAMT